MRLAVMLKELFPYPMEVVWWALTDPAALGTWLMLNDFEPRVGHRFTLRSEAVPGWRGWIEYEVLELDPPQRMVWLWRGGDDGTSTRVVLELRGEGTGTWLSLSQTGETDRTMHELITQGWPRKLAGLRTALRALQRRESPRPP